MTNQYPIQSARKGNAKNFQRKEKIQVLIDGVWVDRTLPCGSRQIVHWLMHFATRHGINNVRIAKAN